MIYVRYDYKKKNGNVIPPPFTIPATKRHTLDAFETLDDAIQKGPPHMRYLHVYDQKQKNSSLTYVKTHTRMSGSDKDVVENVHILGVAVQGSREQIKPFWDAFVKQTQVEHAPNWDAINPLRENVKCNNEALTFTFDGDPMQRKTLHVKSPNHPLTFHLTDDSKTNTQKIRIESADMTQTYAQQSIRQLLDHLAFHHPYTLHVQVKDVEDTLHTQWVLRLKYPQAQTIIDML